MTKIRELVFAGGNFARQVAQIHNFPGDPSLCSGNASTFDLFRAIRRQQGVTIGIAPGV